MKLNWTHWIYTLLKTVIGGVAGTASAWLGTLIGNQVDGNIPVLQFNQLWSVLLSSTLLNLFFFLKQSPLPEDEDKGGSNLFNVLLVLLVGLLAFSFTGCSTTQKPPTPTEQKYFEIRTNTVEVVALVTNVLPATATTVAAVRVEPVTNRVEQYEFVPNANAQLVATTGAAVGTTISPVAGGVVGAAIMGLFSLWGWFRSKNTATANQITAEELAQIIETGRQILLSLPDGAKYEAAYKDWMVKHQAEAGVIGQVAELVALAVDNDKAKGAAQTIVNLIQAQPK